MPSETTLNNFIPALSNSSLIRDKLRNTTFIGIDFGTSTTVVSYAVLGDSSVPIRTETIPIRQILHDGREYESHLIPSIIAWYNNKLLIGEGARFVKYMLTPNKNVWSSFKMKLGINLGPMYYNTDLPFNHPIATIENPAQAATVFFKFIKQGIEEFVKKKNLPQHIEYSVSIPASFESNQRADLLKALKDAGIEISTYSLIDEPNAAFLSYLAESNQNNLGSFRIAENSPIHILVFDFGAGTCDLSLLEIGKTIKGFYSKNIAISRYEEMGGDDIDYLIAKNILLNQMLKENDLTLEDLTTADMNKRIIPKLLKPAEDLKIKICKNIANQVISYDLPNLATSKNSVELGYDLEIALPKRTLKFSKLSIKYWEFFQINNLLFDAFSEDFTEGLKNGKCIRNLLDDILSKANLAAENIDMVLLIGGSSANPYLQKKLRDYFENVEIEIPQDLRSHVSIGAALNSFLVRGLSVNLINPITSEPIMILTKNDETLTLFKAGTPIPTEIFETENLITQIENQRVLEIPICVSDKTKLLTVIRVDLSKYFPIKKDSVIKLKYGIDENKILKINLSLNEIQLKTEYVNPFANSTLSNSERIILAAEKKVNESTYYNKGNPGLDVLYELFEAYKQAKSYQKAAEILEYIYSKNPADYYATNICFFYSIAQNRKKSLEWAQRAYNQAKSPINCFNLALKMQEANNLERYEELMEECLRTDPEAHFAAAAYGIYLDEKDPKRSKELIKKAYKFYYEEYINETLDIEDYARLIRIAKFLGKPDIANEVSLKERKLLDSEKFYSDTNLLVKKEFHQLNRRE